MADETDDGVLRSIKDHEDYPDIIVIMCLLALFSVAGTIGNAFVLYVFSKKRDKSTTTMFILTLAGTDFFTCLIIVPFTIVSEYFAKRIHYDVVCKVYHFLITSNVPFSFFIMVAIAFDRYFKICRPWTHAMDPPIAKRIIFGLLVFAVSLGIITSLAHGVYESKSNESFLEGVKVANASVALMGKNRDPEYSIPTVTSMIEYNTTHDPFATTGQTTEDPYLAYNGKCMASEKYISTTFRMVYQKFYASLFLIAFILVVILYGLIFRSITTRRSRKLNNKMLNGYGDRKVNKDTQPCTVSTELKAAENGKVETITSECLVTGGSEFTTRKIDKRKSVREKQRIANIKTAGILFIVTAVFIVAFLPAWLIATKVLPANIILFYMYFFYNVANPIIYAFFNQTFRTEVRNAMHCK